MSGRDIAREIADAFNRRDADAIAEHYAEDAVVHDPQYPEPLRGREAIRQDMDAWFRSFPDVHGKVQSVLGDDDRYAFEFAMTGTHQGPLATPSGEFPPTGRRIESAVGLFGRVNGDDKIVEERRYYDQAALAEQLGMSG
jgi:steroid delta-isomerase-like uncharacterized protein